ncbi:MAG: hypothetical protein AMXMBFR7_22180 [Planctomycetota bacterium]
MACTIQKMSAKEYEALNRIYLARLNEAEKLISPLYALKRWTLIACGLLLTLIPTAYLKASFQSHPQGLEIEPIIVVLGVVVLVGSAIAFLGVRDYWAMKSQVTRSLNAMRQDLQVLEVEVYDSTVQFIQLRQRQVPDWSSAKVPQTRTVSSYIFKLEVGRVELDEREFSPPAEGFCRQVTLVFARHSRTVLHFSTSGDRVPITD